MMEVLAEFFHDMYAGWIAVKKDRRARLAPRLPDGILSGSLRLAGGSYIKDLALEVAAVTRPCYAHRLTLQLFRSTPAREHGQQEK